MTESWVFLIRPVSWYRGVLKCKRFLALIALVVIVVNIGGCSFGGKKTAGPELAAEPADKLFRDGTNLLRAGQASAASKKFRQIEKVYPYSKWAGKSMLLLAYSNFRSGAYDDTIDAAERYLTLFPASSDSPYAQYLIGQSYFRQIAGVTRDQQNATLAIQAFDNLIQNYPGSEYVEDAKHKIVVARDQLAGHEMEIGRYYLSDRDYVAAINRFKGVVNNYDTTRHIEEALARLTEAYLALGVIPEAQLNASVLGQNYPSSQWYKYAYSLMGKYGVRRPSIKGKAARLKQVKNTAKN